uniref:Uncharacterized protein n=1 Tax=Leersia perrieri TaxID=77586 RepID=A0A0D9WD12_9ORYZ
MARTYIVSYISWPGFGVRLATVKLSTFHMATRRNGDGEEGVTVENLMAATAAMTSPVRRGAAEMVAPARATPYEFKPLSDIDDQDGLRFYRSGIFLYRHRAGAGDPAAVLRAALAEALVHYYPFAGRIVEASPGRKLIVECTGEGAVFVAADLGISLDELVAAGDGGVITGPPVTRFRCGGFAWGIQICHCLADAAGVVQFLTAVGEFARGVPGAPTLPPVWARELLISPPPPRRRTAAVSRRHPEYEPVHDAGRDMISPSDDLLHRPFFFGRRELAALRRAMPSSSPPSRFDLIAAFMWRCRAAALDYPDADAIRVQFVVNARNIRSPEKKTQIPIGYYGNAFAFAVAESTAGDLRRRPLAHAVNLVVAAKGKAMEEGHLQSVAELMAASGRRRFAVARTYIVSDITRSGLAGVDVGWGEPVYGGPATVTLATFHVAARRDGDGEEGVEVVVRFPAPAMERMVVEVARGLAGVDGSGGDDDVMVKCTETTSCIAARL